MNWEQIDAVGKVITALSALAWIILLWLARKWRQEEEKKMQCPACKQENIVGCPGGTIHNRYLPEIQYICRDCLTEFGDQDLHHEQQEQPPGPVPHVRPDHDATPRPHPRASSEHVRHVPTQDHTKTA